MDCWQRAKGFPPTVNKPLPRIRPFSHLRLIITVLFVHLQNGLLIRWRGNVLALAVKSYRRVKGITNELWTSETEKKKTVPRFRAPQYFYFLQNRWCLGIYLNIKSWWKVGISNLWIVSHPISWNLFSGPEKGRLPFFLSYEESLSTLSTDAAG